MKIMIITRVKTNKDLIRKQLIKIITQVQSVNLVVFLFIQLKYLAPTVTEALFLQMIIMLTSKLRELDFMG